MLKPAGAALAVLLFAAPAWAQGALGQQGGASLGQTPMYTDRTHVMGVGGDALGQPPAPTSNAGTMPSLYATVNPLFGNCQFSQYGSEPYARLCSGFDGNGNALISLDSMDSAPAGKFYARINGTLIDLSSLAGLNCGDTAGQHLNFNGGVFSCGTSGGSGSATLSLLWDDGQKLLWDDGTAISGL